MRRNSQRGVALIITLILLSVITFLAIAFLAMSRRERGSVTTTTHQLEARFAADSALERAKTELIANMLAFTNEFAFDLMVSTNYVNASGFDPNNPVRPTLTNVSYVYANGNPLSPDDNAQNIANLFYNPRPPVFVGANHEFRFYLDLNRNGRYDTNGFQPVIGQKGGFLHPDGTEDLSLNNVVSNFFVGDPEWIGGLERPDFPHSPSNHFTHRYAYVAVPIGKALDLNAVHNQAKRISPNQDGFLRNEGVGTWEMNLAAFLTDLNTNAWPPVSFVNGYNYDTTTTSSSHGYAFDDASALVSYRYAGNYNNLRNGYLQFQDNGIDDYSDGSLMASNSLPFDGDAWTQPWSGSDNTNHFFTTQDLFDANKTGYVGSTKVAPPNFADRLFAAGTNVSSYDRYTFYRLLSQLGTDSAAESDKLNLNYVNLRGLSPTNFVSWTPLDFFTNAAERLLRNAGFPFGVTNIPIYNSTNVSVGYAPAVHRLLQLAANLYDATTNRTETPYPYLPSVFRPVFQSANGGKQVYISGFREVTDTSVWNESQLDLNDPAQRAAIGANPNDLVKGIPLVIGAKKGFPNFNEFASENLVAVSRKLQLRKASAAGPVTETNQMYLISITNIFGVEFWNSYSTNFSRPLSLLISNEMTVLLTNQTGIIFSNSLTILPPSLAATIPGNPWPAASPSRTNSFFLPFSKGTNVTLLPLAIWTPTSPYFKSPLSSFDRNSGFPVPQLVLTIKNHLRAMMLDTSIAPPRIVDYVDLAGMDFNVDLASTLVGNTAVSGEPSKMGLLWKTNRLGNQTVSTVPTYGVINQIEANLGNAYPGSPSDNVSDWNNYNYATADKAKGIAAFRAFYYPPYTDKSNTVMQAPFNPTRKMYLRTSWQANDPLVHYFASDLSDLSRTNVIEYLAPPNKAQPTLDGVAYAGGLSAINTRYHPWGGGNPGKQPVPNDYLLSIRDPLVKSSDDWDFPTNKLPNIGWIGRVHRGTPWQTVYLKSDDVDLNTWTNWTGDRSVLVNWDGSGNSYVDGYYTQPIRDRNLFDLFTAAPNDNATRGQLSVNQTGLAAWSAVLSGVIALTNSSITKSDPIVIDPGGIYGPSGTNNLVKIVAAINDVRSTNSALFPQKVFRHAGDILSVPELTVKSPFLNTASLASPLAGGLNDEVVERIPQQILGLLRAGDQRFVIYAYGQSLRPADNSVITSGPYRGLCTNYQIMAEAAMRAVVRVNNATNNPTVLIENYNLLPPD